MSIVHPELVAELLAGNVHLDRGAHDAYRDGHCAMEVVARLAGEGHTDAPACASPVLARYTIRLNDRWNDEHRQALVPYLPRMVGTGGDGQDAAREAIARQALVTDLLSAWLRLAGMDAEADAVAQMGPGDDIYVVLDRVRDAAWDRRQVALQSVREAVKAKLADRPAVAAAAAAAVADAAADADADAAAVADAAADDPWRTAYWAARPIFEKAIAESTAPKWVAIRELAAAQRQVALDVLDRMIDPSANRS